MRKKTPGRVRRGEQQWREILGQFESSKLSPREFCRREGLSLSSFQRWRRQVGQAAAGKFVELTAPRVPSMTPASWSLNVSLPNGVSLRFEG